MLPHFSKQVSCIPAESDSPNHAPYASGPQKANACPHAGWGHISTFCILEKYNCFRGRSQTVRLWRRGLPSRIS